MDIDDATGRYDPQGIAIGLDGLIWGFHVNVTDRRWSRLPAMPAAVKAVDPGFRVMLSPDMTVSYWDGVRGKPMKLVRGAAVSIKVALKAGTTPTFELLRDGRTVHTVKSATPIRTSITLQDRMYHGGGGTKLPKCDP